MADLARRPRRAPVQPPVDDNPAPDAGPEGHMKQVADMAAGPEPRFAQRCRRGIVLDERRHFQASGYRPRELHVP